ESADRSQCLTPEDLAAAAAGEQHQEERERVTNHLLVCRDCAEEYRLIGALQPWCAEASAALLEPAILKDRPPRARVKWLSPHGLAALISPIRPAFALALVMLLASTALVIKIISLNTQNRNLQSAVAEQNELAQRAATAEQSLEQATRERNDAIARSEKEQTEIAQLRDELSRAGSAPRPEFNVPIIDLDPRDGGRGASGEGGKDIQLPKAAA